MDWLESVDAVTNRILLVGMSHSDAINAALSPDTQAKVDYLRINSLKNFANERTGEVNFHLFPKQTPDQVILAIGINYHNVLGMFEHTIPFSVGHSTLGRVPADPSRAFIPLDAVHAVFEKRLETVFDQADQIHAHYPNLPFAYVYAPPPIGDEAHIRKHPGIFAEKLSMGLSPPELRIALYQAQCDVYARQAKKHGASVLPAPAAALTGDGFLNSEFAAKDPTHGNPAYGRLVLEQIRSLKDHAA